MPKTRHEEGYQIKDSPFFRLRTRKKLSRLLRVSTEFLSSMSKRQDLYIRRWKHKSKADNEPGAWLKDPPALSIALDYRPIDIPNPQLKAIQSRIAGLLSRIKSPDFLFSPVKGRSYVDNAARHTEASAFWLLDVADYFPSCTANNVARFFIRDLECSKDVTAIFVRLVTLDGCLPQGSPCSPILAYYSNQHIWLAVADRVADAGCKLSLYADDITISGPVVRKSLIWQVKKLFHSNGLRLKPSKELSLFARPADITGVIVKDGGTYLPNRQLKRLTELKEARTKATKPELVARLERQISGRIAQRRQVERQHSPT